MLSPILSDVAADFGVSIARAGQLRIVAAPLAAVVAVMTGRLLARHSPRLLLATGSVLLAVGSLASAAAPSFVLLALAQVPLWAGISILIAAGVAGTVAWTEPDRRTRVVSHALAGPPSAWIVGMPLIGLVAGIDWRLAFLVLPLPAAVLAGLALLARPPDAPLAGAPGSLAGLLGIPRARRWAIGELCANAAWAGTLVYCGALFSEVYGTSHAVTGLILALVAVAYLAGNRLGGRVTQDGSRRIMLAGSVAAAVTVGLTWALTESLVLTVALFAATAAVTAARMVAGTVYGFRISGGLAREVGAVRAATTQIGYLVGSLAGGVAIDLGGFGLLSVAFGGFFLAATLPYVCVRPRCRLARAAEASVA